MVVVYILWDGHPEHLIVKNITYICDYCGLFVEI